MLESKILKTPSNKSQSSEELPDSMKDRFDFFEDFDLLQTPSVMRLPFPLLIGLGDDADEMMDNKKISDYIKKRTVDLDMITEDCCPDAQRHGMLCIQRYCNIFV